MEQHVLYESLMPLLLLSERSAASGGRARGTGEINDDERRGSKVNGESLPTQALCLTIAARHSTI